MDETLATTGHVPFLTIRSTLLAITAAAGAALLLATAGSPRGIKEGGTFRIAMAAGVSFSTIDPALISSLPEIHYLDPACGTLVAYPSKPLPEGGILRPELAEADPVISKDGRTYTFTVRRDARFSDGARVTARAFVRGIERALDPAMKSVSVGPGLAATLVGGEDVLAGTAKTPSGVSAEGRVLTLKLTKRNIRFLEWAQRLCAVPPSLPATPEGARAPLASPAPYYVSEYVPGERLVLERNRFYRGTRPQHVDRIVADLGADAGAIIDDIASGKIDFSSIGTAGFGERAIELKQRYGVNKAQFWIVPANSLGTFVLNTSRPLFRNNVKLRQALNFAVDRKALTRELGPIFGSPTDQYLSPSQPGYVDERIYPLKGPDLVRARALAKGHTRSGKAVLYTRPNPIDVAQTQILKQNLEAIGIELEVVQFPGQLLFERLATDAELFDIGRIGWPHSPEPAWFSDLFDGRTIGQPGNSNFSYFNSPRYNRLFDEARRLPAGPERNRAFGKLDVELSRDAAPTIPYVNGNAATFVSARTRCVVLNPWLDLTAVCLK